MGGGEGGRRSRVPGEVLRPRDVPVVVVSVGAQILDAAGDLGGGGGAVFEVPETAPVEVKDTAAGSKGRVSAGAGAGGGGGGGAGRPYRPRPEKPLRAVPTGHIVGAEGPACGRSQAGRVAGTGGAVARGDIEHELTTRSEEG